MGTVSLPIGATNSGTNDWSDVHGEDQAIIDQVNGSLSAANLAADAVTTSKILDANVTDAKLASPNNSAYRTLVATHGASGVDTVAGTYMLAQRSSPIASGASASNTPADVATIYFDDADFTVSSKTQKLRLRAQVNTNATAWSSVTATFGLYPVTFAGAADTMAFTLGTVVGGSTVAIANPSASSVNQGNSGDFTIPSDGQYCLGVVMSATLTNNAYAQLAAQLQTRNV